MGLECGVLWENNRTVLVRWWGSGGTQANQDKKCRDTHLWDEGGEPHLNFLLFSLSLGCASCLLGGSVPLLSDSPLTCCHCCVFPRPFHGTHHSTSLPHRARAPTAHQCGL